MFLLLLLLIIIIRFTCGSRMREIWKLPTLINFTLKFRKSVSKGCTFISCRNRISRLSNYHVNLQLCPFCCGKVRELIKALFTSYTRR
jgi:hypothetical protein